jgi:hypothetical protein
MSSIRFFSPLFVVPALALGAACAPVATVADFAAGEGGSTGSKYLGAGGGEATGGTSVSGSSTSSGSGGSGGVIAPYNGSYSYLCGGSHPVCSPDPGSDDCTPGGNPGMGGAAPDASKLTCQLVADNGLVVAQCGMSGEAGDGDPCESGSSCQAGFGCMATSVTGVCRQYCCEDLESCAAKTYCAPVPMAGSPSQSIPLCIPVTPCELLNDATCPDGKTCAIVRADGTTSCIDPGSHTEGEACPCAAGYTCWNSNTCLKLCHTEGGNECGPNGTCQGGTKPYPLGIGFCVPYL